MKWINSTCKVLGFASSTQLFIASKGEIFCPYTGDHRKETNFGPKIFFFSLPPPVFMWIWTHNCCLMPYPYILSVQTLRHEVINVPHDYHIPKPYTISFKPLILLKYRHRSYSQICLFKWPPGSPCSLVSTTIQ